MQKLSHTYQASKIAECVGGTVFGDANLPIDGISSVHEAKQSKLTFVRERSVSSVQENLRQLSRCAVLASKEDYDSIHDLNNGLTVIVVKDPYHAFLSVLNLFYTPKLPDPGIHPSSVIDPSAKIASSASIGPFCYIGQDVKISEGVVLYPHISIYDKVEIGENTIVYSGTTLREGSIIGRGCIIHSNTVIGADGFGYVPDKTVGLRKVPQIGNVEIGDHVEIGANSCIDRATFGSTKIGNGTKIDNLVQIGHNTIVGKNCIICGQVGIAGSCIIEDQVTIGGAAGIADHVKIRSGTRIAAKSGVISSIDTPSDYAGYPAILASEWRRSWAVLRRLVRKEKDKA